MLKKLAFAGAASVLALTGYATGAFGSEETASATGRIYHYIRSNQDGSSPEHVWVYRAADNKLEVYKAVERCTDAAFVTAWIDPTTGRASMINGGRLMPEARHENFATLAYDGTSGRLTVDAALPGFSVHEEERVHDAAWHLYDFDLATLSVQTMGLADPRAGFSFGLPLVWTDPEEGDFLRHLGTARAEFVGEESYRGVPALRFQVGGEALGENGGPLWIDAADGHVLGAQWGIPNHDGMEDFAIRLVDFDDSGEAGWDALLTRHFEGCATA